MMRRTVSIYIDDEFLKKIKEKGIPVSRAIRDALEDWLEKDLKTEDYEFIEKALWGKLTEKGEDAWEELLREANRW